MVALPWALTADQPPWWGIVHAQTRTNCNPGTCPDQESNPQPFSYQTTLQATEPHWPGQGRFFFKCLFYYFFRTQVYLLPSLLSKQTLNLQQNMQNLAKNRVMYNLTNILLSHFGNCYTHFSNREQ